LNDLNQGENSVTICKITRFNACEACKCLSGLDENLGGTFRDGAALADASSMRRRRVAGFGGESKSSNAGRSKESRSGCAFEGAGRFTAPGFVGGESGASKTSKSPSATSFAGG
jgi:hypothetical protein